jgi:hypothetical protein
VTRASSCWARGGGDADTSSTPRASAMTSHQPRVAVGLICVRPVWCGVIKELWRWAEGGWCPIELDLAMVRPGRGCHCCQPDFW